MSIKVKGSVVAAALLMVLFSFDSSIRAQDGTPPPSGAASEPATVKTKSDAAKDQAAESRAAKTEAGNLLKQPKRLPHPLKHRLRLRSPRWRLSRTSGIKKS
jgi:hypothetical protein